MAAWYDLERFTRLFCALLNADRKVGQIRLVRDLIADFRGLSGTGKRKAIIADLGLARASLEDLVKDGAPDRDKLDRLLRAMQAAGTAPKAAALGIVGKEHLLERLQLGEIGQQSFEYRKLIDDDPLSPRVTEIAFAFDAQVMRWRRVLCGINSSPALMGASAFREVGYSWGSGLGNLLENRALRQNNPLAFVLHHTGARLAFADRGKSALAIKGEHGIEVHDAVLKVTEKWNKQHEREIRDSRAATRRDEIYAKRATVSQKDAAAECMLAAYLKASSGGTLPVAPRQIYYAARDHIQLRSGKTLGSKYFSQTLLIDYMDEHPEETANWDIAWDARGNLVEPHTRKTIPLSTLAVRKYVQEKGWRNKYGAVLFCEKEGFQPLFEAVKLGERYDLAIMSSKGTSVTAARTLIDALIKDGDPGLLHPRLRFCWLQHRRHARPRHAPLCLGQQGRRRLRAQARGCQSLRAGERAGLYKNGKRMLTATQAIRAKIVEPLRADGATEEEITFLETHRVELNAFTSGDLIKWIEGKLDEHGVKKVVPDDATLAEEARQVARNVVIERILDEKAKEIDAEVAASRSTAWRPGSGIALPSIQTCPGTRRWRASCGARWGSGHERPQVAREP